MPRASIVSNEPIDTVTPPERMDALLQALHDIQTVKRDVQKVERDIKSAIDVETGRNRR